MLDQCSQRSGSFFSHPKKESILSASSVRVNIYRIILLRLFSIIKLDCKFIKYLKEQFADSRIFTSYHTSNGTLFSLAFCSPSFCLNAFVSRNMYFHRSRQMLQTLMRAHIILKYITFGFFFFSFYTHAYENVCGEQVPSG